jgi:hypothetical protein
MGRRPDRSGRFGTFYDEGACLATPAFESLERAQRDAVERRLEREVRRPSGRIRARLLAIGRSLTMAFPSR